LSEDDDEHAPEILLRRVLAETSAERGFIVVREDGSFQQKFEVRFDRGALPAEVRHFSRSLVRKAIEAAKLVDSVTLLMDSSSADAASVHRAGVGAAVAAPLVHRDEVYGVVYLEFGEGTLEVPPAAREFLAEFAGVAGMFLNRALERETLRRRTRELERDLFARHDFEGIVTRHPKMMELLRTVAQVADSEASVLVRGETGTGKELVARALHVNSSRHKRPFVTLHTAALPGTMLESELFGHKKGAFTGADRDRTGRVAVADGGTLFLDEVAEIAPEVQAKLLRFLQFGEVQRLGSDHTERVDVRVVAASHQDLAALVREGRFRADLYFRLKVIELDIPPLRERASDIPLLVDAFVRRCWRRQGTPRWSPRAERALASYAYPGNVRELAHAVERACILARGPELDLELLPPEMASAAGAAAAAPTGFSEFTLGELTAAKDAAAAGLEETFLAGLMERCGGNVSQAARHAGIHRSQLQKLLARHRPGGR
jgi:Nif-specific regulatory protein/two-component system response regulator HydG